MKNYTLEILEMLTAWLRYKGGDVTEASVCYVEGGEDRLYEASWIPCHEFENEVYFTQSELDANDKHDYVGHGHKECLIMEHQLPIYIRAKLEKEVGK